MACQCRTGSINWQGGLIMNKYALSARNQQVIVAKHITQHGSINRYEADAIGVCSLAARIKDLRYRGFEIKDKRETALDTYGLEHKRISRYWFDYKTMTEENRQKLNKLLGKS